MTFATGAEMRRSWALLFLVCGGVRLMQGESALAAETLRVLILDGENAYHDWQ
jgi:hypothetical protein